MVGNLTWFVVYYKWKVFEHSNCDCLHSLLAAPNLPKVTAVVGLWGWTAVLISFGTVLMLIHCSRYNLAKLLEY